MIASGMLPRDEVDAFIESLKPGTLEVPGTLFAAVGCSAAQAHEALRGLSDVSVSADNCPHQVILCGRELSLQQAVARLKEAGVLCQLLPFRSGFHSPMFAEYLEPHRAHFRHTGRYTSG